MADLNLSIAFSSDQQSIRQIQREINRALRDSSTQIDISVNPNFFRNLTDTIQNLNIEIADLAVNQSAVDAVREQINRSIDIEISEIDVNQRALDDIQKRIEQVTTAIGIQGAIEADFEGARGKGAAPGLSGSIKKQTAQQAAGAGLSLERDIVVQLEQRETLEKTLNQLMQGQVLLQRQINQKLAAGSNKFQDAQIRVVQRLEDIGDDLLEGRIDPSDAIKAIDKLSQSTALSERTFREATPQTRRFLLEVEELAQVTRQIAETIGLQDGTQKRVAREGQRQARFNKEISDLEQQVIDGRIQERDAIRAAVRLAGQVSQSPLGGAESDITARQREANLSRLNALRIGAENALEASRAFADEARDTEEGAKQASSIRARQQRILDRNIQIIQRINGIREDILSGDIRERDARRQLRSIERQGVQTGGIVDPRISRQQQEAEQEALAAAKEALEGLRLLNALDEQSQREKKTRVDAERQATAELSRLDKQAQENRKAIIASENKAAQEAEEGERQGRASAARQRRLIEQNEQTIARINQIRQEVENDTIEERDAQRELTNLRRQGLRTGGIVNPSIVRDLEQKQQEAVSATQESINQLRAFNEDLAEAKQRQENKNAELAREEGFIKEAATIERELNAKRLTTGRAITRINRILAQVEDPDTEIFDEEVVNQLRGTLQNQLSSLREQITNIDKQIEIDKKNESDKEKAQRANERALKAERDAIEDAVEIRQALSQNYINANQATREIVRLLRRSSQGGDILDASVAQDLNDQLQIELRVTKEAVRSKERQEKATKDAADAQKKVDAANKENLAVAKRLNQIFLDQAGGRLSAEQARRSISNLEINTLGDLASVLQGRLFAERERLDNQVEADRLEEENLKALQEEIAQRQTIVNNLLKRGELTQKQIDTANRVGREIQNELFEGQRSGTRQFQQPQRQVAPNDVLFRNAGDVQDFVNNLNPQELERFTQTLTATGRATNNTQRRISGLSSSIDDASDSTTTMNKNVQRGANLAQEFGRQVGLAAVRLLAWAAPANLIFLTISRLRGAVSEIINLDREARRLIFFRNVGSIVTQSTVAIEGSSVAVRELNTALNSSGSSIQSIVNATSKLVATNEQLSEEFRLTADIARQYGLTISAVQDALVTVSRVGQQAADAASRSASVFADAALQLVRLERGALGATEAVRGLTAVQAQFFGGIRGNVFTVVADEAIRAATSAQLTSNAAALLAVTSAGSSANVSELTDAVTRLGSAFVNLQGLNFPQTVAILGEAFTATGASTGRLATALRQSATLIKQNADEIRELTGGEVQVVDESGRVRGFQAILDVLREIRKEAGSLKAVELSLAIADRRNVADVAALAQNVERLQKAFDRFQDPAERARRVLAAQAVQQRQSESLAESLEGRINSLNTAFKQLVEGEELRGFLADVVSAFTGGIDSINKFVSALSSITQVFSATSPVFAILGGAILGRIAAAGLDVAKGFGLAFSNAAKLEREAEKLQRDLLNQESTLRALDELQQRGLINAQQRATFENQINATRIRLAGALAAQLSIQEQLSLERAKTAKDNDRINTLLEQQANNLKEIRRLRKEERREVEAATAEVNALAAAEEKRRSTLGSRRRAVGGFAIAIAPAIAQQLGELDFVEKEFEKRVNSGITAGITGAIAGAQLGAKGGPIGAALGLVAGFFKDDLIKAINDAAKALDQLFGTGPPPQAEEATAAAQQVTATARQILEFQRALDESAKNANEAELEKINIQRKALKGYRDQLTALEEISLRSIQIFDVENKRRLEAIRNPSVGQQAIEFIPVAGAVAAANRFAFDQDILDFLDKRNEKVKEGRKLLAAVVAEQGKDVQGINDAVAGRVQEEQRLANVNRLLKENERLSAIIGDDNAKIASQIAAQRQRTENVTELLEEQNLRYGVVRQALFDADFALRNQERTIRRINNLTETRKNILDTISGAIIEPEFRIDVAANELRSAIADIDARLEGQLEVLKQQGKIGKELRDEEKKAREEAAKQNREALLGFFNEIFQGQEAVVDDLTSSATAQISAWESAAKKVTDAFSNAIKEQSALADIFERITDNTRSVLQSSSERISRFLESTGASVADQLNAVIDDSEAQLAAVREGGQRQLGTLGSRFGGIGAASAAAENLINAIAAEAAGAEQKIVDEQSSLIRSQIAFDRERARAERANFQNRISESRRELSIRRNILNQEIEILNQRLDSERELNQLRREQLEEFGNLLIQSPQDFKKELENIRVAERFFSGIEGLGEESLRRIRGRSQRLRGGGEQGQELLRQVQAGLASATRFGRGNILGGIGNRQLQQVFAASQDESIASLSEVASLIQRQVDEASGQLEEQQKIRENQQRLVSLSEAEAALQQVQARIADATAKIAIDQRERQFAELQKILAKQEDARVEFRSGINRLLAFFQGNDQLTAPGQNLIKELLAGGDFQQGVGRVLQSLIQDFREARDFEGMRTLFGELAQFTSSFAEGLNDQTEKEAEQKRLLTEATEKYNEILSKAGEGLEEFTNIVNQATQGEQDDTDRTVQEASSAFNKFVSGVNITSAGLGRVSAQSAESAKELAKLNDAVTKGEQLTREEQKRKRELEREARRGFRAGRDTAIAESVLDNPKALEEFTSSARRLFQDTQRTDEFVDRARRLRGEGRRGARGVDVDATRALAERVGLTGAASEITTRAKAVEFLDNVIDVSQRLAKEQEDISRSTQKKITEILATELTQGIQQVVSDTRAAANQERTRSQEAFEERQNQREDAAGNAVAQAGTAAAEAIKEAANTLVETITGVTVQVDPNSTVKVDPIDLNAEISVAIRDRIEVDKVAAIFAEALGPLVGNAQLTELLARNMRKVIVELARQKIITAPLPGEGIPEGVPRGGGSTAIPGD